MITLERLTELLARFPRLRIGLIGDLFLDRYLEIHPGPSEVSIETGLEAHQVTSVRNCPGALGTVMNNLSALGVGLLKPLTVIGDDGHAFDLLRCLEPLPIDTSHILRCRDRLTPTYTKPLRLDTDGRWQELNRLDVRTRGPLSQATRRDVVRQLDAVVQSTDGLIVLDQVNEENLGVIHEQVRRRLEEICDEQPERLIFIDSREQLSQFSFGVLKGNAAEIVHAAGDARNVNEAAQTLAGRTGRLVFCTIGERGMLVAEPTGDLTRVTTWPVSGPTDIVGAGDSASSALVLALLSGADAVEAAEIGNLVASITVQQLGTTGTASPEQVIARWREISAIQESSRDCRSDTSA